MIIAENKHIFIITRPKKNLDPWAGHWGAQKLNKSCDPSVDRKFYIDEENMYF
jgi:hypothetical protein